LRFASTVPNFKPNTGVDPGSQKRQVQSVIDVEINAAAF